MGNNATRNSSGSNRRDKLSKPVDDQIEKKTHGSSLCEDNEPDCIAHFKPVDKLIEILAERARHENDGPGISENIFSRYLFPSHRDFASLLYRYFHKSSGKSSKNLDVASFKQQVQRFLSIMNDRVILDTYIEMYSNSLKDNRDISPETLKSLFNLSYCLGMDNDPVLCENIDHTINAALSSCFHDEEKHSVSFVSNWLWEHCPKVVHGVHRYVVHVLTTSYRNGSVLLSTEELQPHIGSVVPVIEPSSGQDHYILTKSHVWLLSTGLPSCFVQADPVRRRESSAGNTAPDLTLSGNVSGIACPKYWTLLYTSELHGAGANRLLHHILGYRSPTILLIKGDCGNGDHVTFCLGSAIEWRESHLYWGDDDSVIIQLQPVYKIVEKGSKLFFLNTGIRGYPQGLRAGKDPRNPLINIDNSFNSVNFNGAPYRIMSIEAWGCGDPKSRERQLEIKNWQVKEAEKQRVVKLSTADWLDHPDRYLLELAGRPSYSNTDS